MDLPLAVTRIAVIVVKFWRVGQWLSGAIFFLGELSAAAALAGLLFVSISVNQTRILKLGRMSDRAFEALGMLLLVVICASLPLIPRQSLRILGAEVFLVGVVALLIFVPRQMSYLRHAHADYHHRARRIVYVNRIAEGLIVLGGLVMMWRGDEIGLYLLPPGFILTFLAVGMNAWVLLIEINRDPRGD